MSHAPHALIAGAGIGGATLALALARRGWRVTLLERRQWAEDIGAGVQISPNASAVLRDLDVLPRLAQMALYPEAIHLRRARDGITLARLPLADAQARWGAPYLVVHRGDLHAALIAAATQEPAISLHAPCALAGFSATEDGVTGAALHESVRVAYAADCLIGADGVRSLVRQRLADLHRENDDAPASAHHVAFRALVKADHVAPDMRRGESTLWLGPGAHLVHYPLRGGSIVNVVAIVDHKIPVDWSADMWSQAAAAKQVAGRFARWHPMVRDLIAAADCWRQWPLIARATPRVWSSGRVTLLGDAAHPMLPFLAQGAAQAIEDAAVLADFLAPGNDIAIAFARFAAARRERATRVQRQSQRQAKVYHLSWPAARLRDIGLRALGPDRLLARYDWLYGGGPGYDGKSVASARSLRSN